jgi:hypothetical protein
VANFATLSRSMGHEQELSCKAAAARVLGIHRHEVTRAMQIAALSDEAKAVAKKTGMDNNYSVLLAAAKSEGSDPAMKAANEGASVKAVRAQIAQMKFAPTAACETSLHRSR